MRVADGTEVHMIAKMSPPGESSKRRVEYEISLVTYVDILGFKKLIETKTAGEISRIIRVVREAIQPRRFKTSVPEVRDDEYVNFSDLTVISTPIQQPSPIAPAAHLFSRLLHLVHAQSRLLFDDGIVLRGGITIGNVVKSWKQLYGPAIVRAYELEHKHAKVPRIIIDDRIFQIIDGLPGVWHNDEKTDKRYISKLTRTDSDGWLFIDYLRAVRNELDDPGTYPDCLNRHRRLIDKKLKEYSDDPDVRPKYEWLDHYHNSTVAKFKKLRR